MSHFPLFISLKDKKCVVVGGGQIAERKIEALLQFEADILVVSPEITNKISALQHAGKLKVLLREYDESVLEGAFMVIAATSDHGVNTKVYTHAVQRNALINVVDCPELCTFLFPSIINRGELTVGITTSGAYPALSKRLRMFLETVIPENYGEVLNMLKAYRKKAGVEIPDPQKRQALLNALMDVVESKGSMDLDEMQVKFNELFEEYKNEKSS